MHQDPARRRCIRTLEGGVRAILCTLRGGVRAVHFSRLYETYSVRSQKDCASATGLIVTEIKYPLRVDI
jgi:hypothetical protein